MKDAQMYMYAAWTLINVVWSLIVYVERRQENLRLRKQKTYQVHALLRAMKGVIWTPGEERDLDMRLRKLAEARERWGVLDAEVKEIEQKLKEMDLHRIKFGVADPDNSSNLWLAQHRTLIEHIVDESEHIDELTEQLPELFA